MLSTGSGLAGSRWAVSTTTFGWLYLTCALAMRIASTPSANLSYLMIAAYALLGRAHAIRALAISWLFSMLNPAIVADATAGSIGRYAVVAGAAVAVLWRSSRASDGMRVRPVILTTLLLGASIVLHAFFFSSMIDVSILKISSWTVVMATVLSAWLGLSPKDRATVCQQIFGGLVLLLLVSLPFLASGLGYLRNGFGFQGVMNHPQAFGPTMALLGAWAASSMLGQRRPAWTLVGLVSLSIVLVFLSEARTAGISVLVGGGGGGGGRASRHFALGGHLVVRRGRRCLACGASAFSWSASLPLAGRLWPERRSPKESRRTFSNAVRP